MKRIVFALTVLLCASASLSASGSKIHPVHLTCEYLERPAVLDVKTPELSWINAPSDSTLRGLSQKAYQIKVYSITLGKKVLVWDSGKTEDGNSLYIKYGGRPLVSCTDYRWQVRVWDNNGKVSKWSESACWTTGYMDSSEWKAKWIGAPWQDDGPRLSATDTVPPAPLLRKDFTLKGKVVSAKAFVTGLGYFELYLNGSKVGDDFLVPGQTDYDYRPGLENGSIPSFGVTTHRILYLSYDITSLLRKGDNRIGAILGNGFYNTKVHYWTKPYGAPRFLAQVEVRYSDGTTETIISDESWQARQSAIRMDGVYSGEVYDARFRTPRWSDPDENSSDWKPVAIRETPDGKLQAQTAPTDKVMERLKPIRVERRPDGKVEVEFKEQITGWLRMDGINAPKGDTLGIEYVCEYPLGVNKFISDGSVNDSYAARFTWFAFSEAIISGWRGDLSPEHFTGEAVHTEVKENSTFACSNQMFNQLNKIWRRTQTDNMHGCIASDCPHRERSAYLGDGQVVCETVLDNFEAASFYSKWIDDMLAAQNPHNGYVPNAAPPQPSHGGGIAWGAAMTIFPWEHYLRYGDKSILERTYDGMKAQLAYMSLYETPEGTMFGEYPIERPGNPCYWMNLGDWNPPYKLPAVEIVHTYFYWKVADLTGRVAKALGDKATADSLSAKASAIRTAFHKTFFAPDAPNGPTYGYGEKNYSLGLDIDYWVVKDTVTNGNDEFALAMGAVPDSLKDVIVKDMVREIDEHGGRMITGIFGIQIIFELLADLGLNEKAYAMLNATEFPSYGYWLSLGATTMWEEWNGNSSHNQPMFGSALGWLYRKAAGLNKDENAPAYKHLIVKPMPPEEMTWAEYSPQTPYGLAGVKWSKEDRDFCLDVTVPVGCTATVYFPCKGEYSESGEELSAAAGVTVKGEEGDRMVVETVSGKYHFRVKKQ